MLLEEKIIRIEALYQQLDETLEHFQSKTGLGCISGCSACCRSTQVEATILEMLPLAFHLYKENKANAFYDLLQDNTSPICSLYSPIKSVLGKGGCENYPYRALICRLFGFSFSRDKIGKPELATCKKIKEVHHEAYDLINQQAANGSEVPLIEYFQNQLSVIDPYLSQTYYPINKAMSQAIELLMTHFHYTDALSNDEKKVS